MNNKIIYQIILIINSIILTLNFSFYFFIKKIINSNFKIEIILFSYLISFILFLLFQNKFIKFLSKNFLLKKEKIKKIYIKKTFILIIFILILIPNLLIFLSYFPGIYSIDSFNIIEQIKNKTFNDSHPFFYTFTLFLIINIFKEPLYYILLQIILYSLIFAYLIKKLKEKNINSYLILFIIFLININPVNYFNIITLWKDIPYSIFLLILSILIMNLTKKNKIKFLDYLILLFITLMIMFFRHNGLFTIIIFYLLIFLLKIKINKKFLIKVLIISIFIFFSIKKLIYPIFIKKNNINFTNISEFNIKNAFKPHLYYFSIPYIKKIKKNEKYYQYFNKIYPINNLPNIQGFPYYSDILFRDKTFKIKNLYEKDDIYLFFLKIVLKKPKEFLKNLLKNYSLIYKIKPYNDSYTYIPLNELSFLNKNNCNYYKPYCNYITKSKIPILKIFFDKINFYIINNKLLFLIWRPALYLVLSVILFLIIYSITKDINYIIPLISIFSNLIPYFLIILPQDARYFYINTLIFYFYLILFFSLLRFKNKKNIKSSPRSPLHRSR